MSFVSKNAHLIWDRIYQVSVPDQITMDTEYIRKFGVRSTGDKNMDKIMANSFTTVMIPPIKMLEYYDNGIEIRIPNRDDMLQIHRDIEAYLDEWGEHLKYSINLDVNEYKPLITSLENFSKEIYGKAKIKEVIGNMFVKPKFGLVDPITVATRENNASKPDYKGITDLVRERSARSNSRF